jgi:DNA repair exonuclease SbcCD ATPase subunit
LFNIIALSDIHIGEYRLHNDDSFRLQQFEKLADVIQKSIEKNSAKEVWIAGDLLREAQSKPRVMYVVNQFLQKIASSATVRLILGNHDVVVRSEKTLLEDYEKCTLISLLQHIENLHIYLDDIVNVNGKKVHFHSWVPTNKFERKEADYLVCHGDINKKLSPFSSNYIDSSGYTKVFCGHIHIFKEIDNVISLGVPLQHNFGDDPCTGLVVYDLDSDTFKHEETDFLKFIYAKSEDEALAIKENSKDDSAEIRVKVDNTEEINIEMDNLNINPVEIVDQFCKPLSDEAKEITYEITHKPRESDDKVANLNFDIQRVKAKNFLSIRDIDFDFHKYDGLTVIRGLEGAGKSTLFNLVEFMFFGRLKGYNKSDYSNVHKEGAKLEGTLWVRYKGNNYRIERTLNTLQFFKNENVIDSNRKKGVQEELELELDFLRFWNLIYIKQYSSGIFSEMSDTSRVSFLSSLIGLNVINQWTSEIQARIEDISNEIKDDNISIIELSTKLKETNSFISENNVDYIDTDLYKKQIEMHTLESNSLENKIQEYNLLIQNYKNTNTNIKNDINKFSKLQDEVQKLKESIKKEKETLQTEKKELDSLQKVEIADMGLINSKLEYINNELIEFNSKNAILNTKLHHLENHPDICPTCKQKWEIQGLDEEIKKLKNEINANNAEIEKFKAAKDKLNSVLNSVNLNIEHNNDIDIRFNVYNNKLQSLKFKAQDLKSKNDLLVDFNIDEQNNIINNNLKNIKDLESEIVSISENKDKIRDSLNKLNRQLGEIEINNQIFNKVQQSKENLSKITSDLNNLETKVQSRKDLVDELYKFNTKVLSDKGLLVAAMLKKVSDFLNIDKSLKVETVHELQSGTLKPTLNIKLFVPQYNKYVDYAMLSGGQALMADLKFLKGITQTLGSVSVMFLDEILKFFSADTVLDSIELLKEINVNKIFLILHGDYETNSNVIKVELDKEKGSVYS